ncbi:MAG: alginate lyase family protein [Williamsia sp.]|nr:alginate lyase family protein [Williamsia sp.]
MTKRLSAVFPANHLLLTAFLILAACGQVVLSQPFVHPGLLHSSEDLDRIKQAVAARQEPVYAGFELFRQNPVSQSSYQLQGPLEQVGRNPTVGQAAYDNDANAAHQNAIMWAITGDKAYADKAIQILNAWSSTLRSITGRDAVLMAGLGPFKMVNAAEIIRYTRAGWKEEDIRKTEKHFREVIYPVIKDFAPFANGNWDAAALKTAMAIGIFCNDRPLFERALRYYVNGAGNGSLTHYIINEEGQVQETGRDQAHTQLGIGLLGDCCEMAWHQGLDLYGYMNNRLLKGFEYTAKYNLGDDDIPFVHVLDRTGKYEHFKPSPIGRNDLRAVYEQIYNHYVNRRGIAAPYTQQAAEKLRPEGPGRPGADHPGYGTLFYTRPPAQGKETAKAAPMAPGGLIATGRERSIFLTWVASVGANRYIVKRAVKSGGPYTIIAHSIDSASYRDTQVEPGQAYYYTVSAVNRRGESPNACECKSTAGLPVHWKQAAIGKVSLQGSTDYDGDAFRIEAGGWGLDSGREGGHVACTYLKGDGEIIARLVPQPSSQFSRMGLIMMDSLVSGCSQVLLLLYPGKTGQVEAPAWQVRLLSRTSGRGKLTTGFNGPSLQEPAVTFGRLTGYYWLRLQRRGDIFTGYGSYDGKAWTLLGSVTATLKKEAQAGIFAASGMPNSTTIVFDNVLIH